MSTFLKVALMFLLVTAQLAFAWQLGVWMRPFHNVIPVLCVALLVNVPIYLGISKIRDLLFKKEC
jgi:hypothetical protein